MQHKQDPTLIKKYLKQGQNAKAFKLFEHLHPTEIAEILSTFTPDTIQSVLSLFPKQRRGAISCDFSYEKQADIAQLLETSDLISLLQKLC